MRNKKIKIIAVAAVVILLAAVLILRTKRNAPGSEISQEIKPTLGSIQKIISTTGTVLPKNRLEVKPPVNGRIEELAVKEGEYVKAGQVLAQMSSTERAALLDAARGKGEDALKYWKEVYKAIPLVAPIDGEVIVAKTQAGQTVTTADAIVVLSDRLIIRAQVDETDIGRIKLGQDALVVMDAYPDIKIKSRVDHIYYESKTVNNVTIYEVDLIPESVPSILRSGMNTTVNFIIEAKSGALLLPLEALIREKDDYYVLVKENNSAGYARRKITIGIKDDKNAEVISGVSSKDTIVFKSQKYSIPKNNMGSNPFLPSRNRRTDSKDKK